MDNIETATISRGALSFVLQIARITGAVPLSLKAIRNGYSISLSSYQLAYSYFLVTTFNIIGVIGSFLYWKQSNSQMENESDSEVFLVVLERMSCILVCSIAYMGAERMKNLIYHINILEKIRNTINYRCKSIAEDKKNMWLSSTVIITYVISSILEITLSLLNSSKWDIVVILMNVHFLENISLLLLQIQIVVLIFEVYKVLLELKERMLFLVTLADNSTDHLTTTTARMIKNGVRSLTQCYVSVCDVVKKINNTDGLYMFIMYACFQLFAVVIGYRVTLILNPPRDVPFRFVEFILQCFWCLTVVMRTTFFVEPFYRTSKKVAEIKVILTQLVLHMTPPGNQVSTEIDTMTKQFLLIAPEYCPLGIYTLNRSLITNTYNAIITWLVFMFSK